MFYIYTKYLLIYEYMSCRAIVLSSNEFKQRRIIIKPAIWLRDVYVPRVCEVI